MTSLSRQGLAVQHGRPRQPAWTARERAVHYREQAAQFERMAEAETQSNARDRLLDLARQYDSLAAKLNAECARISQG